MFTVKYSEVVLGDIFYRCQVQKSHSYEAFAAKSRMLRFLRKLRMKPTGQFKMESHQGQFTWIIPIFFLRGRS